MENQITLSPPKTLYHWLQVYLLYRKAFPASERKPFSIILNMYRKGKTDLWCILRDGSFAGFAAEDGILDEIFAQIRPDADTILTMTGRIAKGMTMERVKDFLKKAAACGAKIVVDCVHGSVQMLQN